jgi:PAS domain-containing protein
MRTNLPVTTVEYPITDETLIVSKTDTKGRLTYFNDQFVDAAGFIEAELMGQPHNIIRHPDMPPEAFADLWATLKAGKPWAGAVKNRRKNAARSFGGNADLDRGACATAYRRGCDGVGGSLHQRSVGGVGD